jgi:ribosomal-protein-alanine N-acetyltransferase
MKLETKRLFINAPTEENLSNWCNLHANADVMRYIGGSPQLDTIKQWLQSDISHYQKHGFCMGSVFEKKSKKFIGRAGIVYLNYDDTQSDLEIGYVLHKTYWQQGYATELVQALIKWGFSNLSTTKLVAAVHPENKKSQRVLEKAGMQFSRRMHYHGSDSDLYEIFKEGLEK